jgi:peptide/nickel transport system ATP-binding protein
VSAPPLVVMDGVHKRFSRGSAIRRESLSVLRGIDMRVLAGEAVGLIGGSGAGKSTLARIVAGLSRPDGGRVLLDGVDLYDAPREFMREARRLVHLMQQDPYDALAPHLRIRDAVIEPLRFHRLPVDPQEAAANALAEVDLPIARFGDRYPHQLSGGERQRVVLARALVTRPRLIVADEPTSMVDYSARSMILDLMARVRAQHGIAVLYVTHDFALARRACDRVIVLHEGRIVEEGPSAAVLQAPVHPYTQRLAGASRTLSGLRPVETG